MNRPENPILCPQCRRVLGEITDDGSIKIIQNTGKNREVIWHFRGEGVVDCCKSIQVVNKKWETDFT